MLYESFTYLLTYLHEGHLHEGVNIITFFTYTKVIHVKYNNLQNICKNVLEPLTSRVYAVECKNVAKMFYFTCNHLLCSTC